MPLGAMIAGLVTFSGLLIGGVVFATTVANQGQANTAEIASLTVKVHDLEKSASDSNTRTALLEERYSTILDMLSQFRVSFEKLETRFNIK